MQFAYAQELVVFWLRPRVSEKAKTTKQGPRKKRVKPEPIFARIESVDTEVKRVTVQIGPEERIVVPTSEPRWVQEVGRRWVDDGTYVGYIYEWPPISEWIELYVTREATMYGRRSQVGVGQRASLNDRSLFRTLTGHVSSDVIGYIGAILDDNQVLVTTTVVASLNPTINVPTIVQVGLDEITYSSPRIVRVKTKRS